MRLRDSRLNNGVGGVETVLYEKNITSLPKNKRFGIAAVTADGHSSGIRWASCFVDYDDHPSEPRRLSASSLSPRSARVSWNLECPDLSAVPLLVRISYCEIQETSGNLDFLDCTSPVKEADFPLEGPADIKDLRPFTTVIFSLSIISVVGISKNSLPVKVVLPEDVPSGPPASLSVMSLSSSSLNIKWSPPLPQFTNGVLISYEISTYPSSGAFTTAGSVTEAVIDDLSPYTQYKILVAACTSVGCAIQSPVETSAVTLPGVPAPVNMLSLNSLEGHLSWAYEREDCHSSSCSFDVNILRNSSVYSVNAISEYCRRFSL